MFQIIVGSRQIRHVIAVEEPAEVTAGDFEEVVHRIAELSLAGCMTKDGPQQAGEPATDLLCGQLRFILQQLRRAMHPPIADFNAAPSVTGAILRLAQDGVQGFKAPSINNIYSTVCVGYTMPHANGCAVIGEVGRVVAASE